MPKRSRMRRPFSPGASKSGVGCVLLDMRLPGVNGIRVPVETEAPTASTLPVVFMTAHGDVATSVTAMKGGAVDFLQKPLRNCTSCLNAIKAAFSLDRGPTADTSSSHE